MPTSVLILGHSFTKRLQSWCVSNNKINLNLTNDRIQIFWHGIGGAILLPKDKPKSVHQSSYLVHELDIDVVFLDIGSNDLCNVNVSVDQYISGLFTFIQSLMEKGCRKVIVSEILERRGPHSFNVKVSKVNSILKLHCSSSTNIIFWSHSRNNFNRRFVSEYVCDDGVHVHNIKGMPRYYMSIRSAILFTERRLQRH